MNPLDLLLAGQGGPPQMGPGVPDPAMIAQQLLSAPGDPTEPIRSRPATGVLRDRKEAAKRYWAPRNRRMMDDERILKMQQFVPAKDGMEDLGGDETVIGNDAYVLVEKAANMVSSQEPIVQLVPPDPGLKDLAQKVIDLLYWWREEADYVWTTNLHSYLSREELYFLAMRGWVAGRIMLDPGNPDFPYRYDLLDPIHVYPSPGDKVRWVFHTYRDTKLNIMSSFGWDQGLLDRVEAATHSFQEGDTTEIASYFDDVWHVVFVNDQEVWSAPHNYGFVPVVCQISFGPPTRKTDTPVDVPNGLQVDPRDYEYQRWIGVSMFEGVKQTYKHLNKLASAVLTEAMKAPNPPVVVYTDQKGEAEGKTIDTSIGATNYLLWNKEKFDVVQYGFRPSELAPLMQLLQGSRDRGSLPSVMYGEGANFMSGFAVSLLTSGARDILLPLVKAHERYLSNLYRCVLRVTAETYHRPISMIATDPDTGDREQFSQITPDEIRSVGYAVRVTYKNVTPQDKQMLAMVAGNLVDKKIIDLDTARGPEFIGIRNPGLVNKRVLRDMAYLDPEVIKASIPLSLLETDPSLYWTFMEVKRFELEQQMEQLRLQMGMGGQPPGPPQPPGQGSPPRPRNLPPQLAPKELQGSGPPAPPRRPPQVASSPVAA